MEKIKGIAIVSGKAMWVELEDKLESYYDLLNCKSIEIPTREIGGTPYCIVCDEEGLLHGDNHVSATNHCKNPMLVGDIFICRELNGDLISLEPTDIMNISRHLHSTRQLDTETDTIRIYEVVECELPVYKCVETEEE